MPTIEQRLSQWQQELLDRSNRNRLLNFRPSTSRPSSIQLLAPPVADLYQALLQGKSFLVVGNDQTEETLRSEDVDGLAPPSTEMVNDGQLVTLSRGNSLTDRSPVSLSAPLRPGTTLSSMPLERTSRVALRLVTRARASEQEQGINTLFAVFGLLKWQEKPGEETWRYAPLVMLPLRIDENAREGSYRIAATGDEPEFNQTLSERLKRDFALDVAVELDEDIPLINVFGQIQSAIGKQRSWEVLEQVHIGLFQFHKLRMYEDLSQHSAIASQHEIIQALGLEGVTIAGLPEGVPSEEELDRVVVPEHSFTVLDADASQLRAVQAAVRGAHLIIQGPPGTGKSQTIANIIAESIAAGRTVLFVSEKAAAIEVVYRRLEERGLGDFCLMLHSQKANKRDVIHGLGARLQSDPPTGASVQEHLNLKRLQKARTHLNSYPEALHRRRVPLGESAFWVHGELAALHDVPYLTATPPPVDELTLEQIGDWQQLLDQAARCASVLREGTTHPWAGIRSPDLGLAERETLRHTLSTLRGAAGEVQIAGQLLAQHLELPLPSTLHEAQDLVYIAGVLSGAGELLAAWFDVGRLQQIQVLAREGVAHAAAIDKLTTRLLARYTDQLLAAATPEAIASYERSPLARLFSSSHRQTRALVRSAAKDGQQRSIDEELSSLRDAAEIKQHLAWFQEREAILDQTLGVTSAETSFPDLNRWTRMAADVSAAAAIVARFATNPPPVAFVEAVCRPGLASRVAAPLQRLDAAIARVNEGLAALKPFYEAGHVRFGNGHSASVTLDSFCSWLDERLARFGDLDPWLRSQAILAQAEDAGIGHIIEHLLIEEIPPSQWSDGLRRLILTHWLDRVFQEDEVLREFRGDDHEASIAQFRSLDHAFIDTSSRRIRHALASRQARVSSAHGGEPGLLRYEASKRKRHIPLRRLFERIPNLLPTLKPCLMMSPLSVAQFLPADRYRFDVVIFDEASQVRPHDAIGAIMRGNQLVVAVTCPRCLVHRL